MFRIKCGIYCQSRNKKTTYTSTIVKQPLQISDETKVGYKFNHRSAQSFRTQIPNNLLKYTVKISLSSECAYLRKTDLSV